MVDSVLEVQNIKTTGISPQKDIVTTNSGTGAVTVNGIIVVPDSGTIGSASATNAVTIDSSGKVGIGTSSPSAELEVRKDEVTSGNTYPSTLRLTNGQDWGYGAGLEFAQPPSSGAAIAVTGSISNDYDSDNNYSTRFYTMGSGTLSERLRIDSSGNVGIGEDSPLARLHVKSTGTGSYGIYSRQDAGSTPYVANMTAASTKIADWLWYGTSKGSITINSSGSGVAYNTSSDYRLKEDWQPMTGSIDRLKALNPVNFAWKVDGSRVDGFLAHEAQEVVPEAVTGEKDAVDADGNPEYQGIDQAKLVPLLTAALQEAVSKIEALTARIEALENAAG